MISTETGLCQYSLLQMRSDAIKATSKTKMAIRGNWLWPLNIKRTNGKQMATKTNDPKNDLFSGGLSKCTRFTVSIPSVE